MSSPRYNSRRSHSTVSGFNMRSPIRTPSFYTEPLPCIKCVQALAVQGSQRGLGGGTVGSFGKRHATEPPGRSAGRHAPMARFGDCLSQP